MRAGLFACGAVLLAALTAVSRIEARAETPALLALLGVAGAAYLASLLIVARGGVGSNRDLAICLVLAAAWRLPLVASAPLLSDDVYRYVWDGRVQRLGYDPYVVAPADPGLAVLHTADTRRIDPTSAELPTVYPPAAEIFFRAVTGVRETPRAIVVAIVVCDALIAVGVWLWLRATGRSPWWVLAYAWSPLVAIEGAGGGHVDLLGVACLVWMLVALTRGRTALAALAWSAAIGVKFLPVVLAPLVWRRLRWRDAAIAAACLVALYAPFATADRLVPLGSLGEYARRWRFNGPVFGWLEPGVGLGWALAAAIGAGLIVAIVARTRLAATEPSAWAWPMAATLLAMPTVYPWYLLWLAPFLVTRGTAPLAVWTVTVLLSYAVWPSYVAGAAWKLPSWVVPVEYGVVAATAGWIMLARTRTVTRTED